MSLLGADLGRSEFLLLGSQVTSVTLLRFSLLGLWIQHSLAELFCYLGVKAGCESGVLNYSVGNKTLS